MDIEVVAKLITINNSSQLNYNKYTTQIMYVGTYNTANDMHCHHRNTALFYKNY